MRKEEDTESSYMPGSSVSHSKLTSKVISPNKTAQGLIQTRTIEEISTKPIQPTITNVDDQES